MFLSYQVAFAKGVKISAKLLFYPIFRRQNIVLKHRLDTLLIINQVHYCYYQPTQGLRKDSSRLRASVLLIFTNSSYFNTRTLTWPILRVKGRNTLAGLMLCLF